MELIIRPFIPKQRNFYQFINNCNYIYCGKERDIKKAVDYYDISTDSLDYSLQLSNVKLMCYALTSEKLRVQIPHTNTIVTLDRIRLAETAHLWRHISSTPITLREELPLTLYRLKDQSYIDIHSKESLEDMIEYIKSTGERLYKIIKNEE